MARKSVAIGKVINLLETKHIEYEQDYITFKYKGKRYQVFRVDKETNVYRLNIIRGNKCVSEDFSLKRIDDLLTKIKYQIEWGDDDDFYE